MPTRKLCFGTNELNVVLHRDKGVTLLLFRQVVCSEGLSALSAVRQRNVNL